MLNFRYLTGENMITTNGRQQVFSGSFLSSNGENTKLVVPILGQTLTLNILFVAGEQPKFDANAGPEKNSISFTFAGYSNPLGTTATSSVPVIEFGPYRYFVDIVHYYINDKNLVHVFVNTDTPL